jgi:hypothetical protein
MENVQGIAGSHWTPPAGEYSLRIAPAAAGLPFKTTSIKNTPTTWRQNDDIDDHNQLCWIN